MLTKPAVIANERPGMRVDRGSGIVTIARQYTEVASASQAACQRPLQGRNRATDSAMSPT